MTQTNKLTMQEVLNGVEALRQQKIKPVNGAYICYLDNSAISDLFQDDDFKYFYRVTNGSDAYKIGSNIELLGIRFMVTDNTPSMFGNKQPKVYRALLCGKEVLSCIIR